MNVCGWDNSTRLSLYSARATRALNFFSSVQLAFQRSASFVTSRNPALWRVFAYSAPGFPRPTMRNMFSTWGGSFYVVRVAYCVTISVTQHETRTTRQTTSSSRRERRLSCRPPEQQRPFRERHPWQRLFPRLWLRE